VQSWLGLLLSLGLVLTFATKLRFSGLPIGLGEVLISIWVIVVLSRSVFNTNLIWSPATITILVFWILTFLLLGIGWLVANKIGVVSTQSTHNILAYLFAFAICCALVINISYGQELDSLFIQTISIFGCLYLFLYTISLLFPTIFDDYFYYYMEWSGNYAFRFHGLSNNPNQLAVILVIAPFLCVTMAKNRAILKRTTAILLLILFIVIGLHTKSEALLLAWIVGLVVLLLPKSMHKLFGFCKNNRSVAIGTSFLFLVICAFLFFKYDVNDRVFNAVNVVYLSDGNQGSIRANLITNGLKSLFESPIVGFGPGSFSGHYGPFENQEVHTTPLDWATQTGSIGLVLLVCLIGYSMLKAWKSNRMELFAGMTSLIIFAQFHYVLRQPIVWVFIVYLITLEPKTRTNPSIILNVENTAH